MSRGSGFLRAVVFAALAGIGFVPAVTMARGAVGATTAASLYLVLAVALFFGLARVPRSKAVAAVTLVVGAGLLTTWLSSSLAATACVLTLVIAATRARIVQRQRPPRPWLVEGVLGVLALAVAGQVADHDLHSMALAVWAYFLVQAASCLLGSGAADTPKFQPDPFDVALGRATDLMDRNP